MSRAEPLITAEELQCLLGAAPASSKTSDDKLRYNAQIVHFGAVLWLVKGVFLYWSLMSPEASSLLQTSRYLWMRSSLEVLCLVAFWSTALHPRGRNVAQGTMLVASTTLVMDLLAVLALP